MLEPKTHFIAIEAHRGWRPVNFRELWKFRELLYFLAWRDIKVKYRQTVLGIVWVILQPVLGMAVFSIVFGKFAKIPSDGVPYPIFVFTGLLPWTYFSSVLGQSTTSLVTGANLISKIYFPRLIIPASSAVATLLDFCLGWAVLGLMLVHFGIGLGASALLAPLLAFLTLMNALGFGLWFSALNVRYRDIQYAIPFIIQVWLFATPVIYPISLLGNRYGWILSLNPMAGVIEGFRSAILGHTPMPWGSLAISTSVGVFFFVTGAIYFSRVERYFADII